VDKRCNTKTTGATGKSLGKKEGAKTEKTTISASP
jgi:hypothetical protein